MLSTNGHGPKRAILYARVSTDEQARSGYSLDQQLEGLTRPEEALWCLVLQPPPLRNQTSVREWPGRTKLPPHDQGIRQTTLGVDRRARAGIGNTARVGGRCTRGH